MRVCVCGLDMEAMNKPTLVGICQPKHPLHTWMLRTDAFAYSPVIEHFHSMSKKTAQRVNVVSLSCMESHTL